jgi:hypothetical protein
VPRTQPIDEVLAAAKHFQRATSDYVFPSPKTGGQMSGFTKMVARLIKEAEVARFTMHDLTTSTRCATARKRSRLVCSIFVSEISPRAQCEAAPLPSGIAALFLPAARDQSCALKNFQVLGNGRTTDGERLREFGD